MSEETTQYTEVTQEPAPAAAPAAETTAAPDAGLTINDLIVAFNFIQLVAQRGGIQAKEMSTIGSLHDRLFKFLDAQGAFDQSKNQEAASS